MPRLLCYGDSNTWGYATEPRPDGRYGDSERWPCVLAAELGSDWQVIEEGLSGRTTVHQDPIEGRWLDGSSYLLPCLRTHAPLDIVVVLLGTNDLKARFSATPYDIAAGVGVLLDIIAKSATGPGTRAPHVLVVCPPPILPETLTATDWGCIFEGGIEKSRQLRPHYERMAREMGAAFLDAGEVITSSPADGIHLDPEMQVRLGKAVAKAVKAMG